MIVQSTLDQFENFFSYTAGLLLPAISENRYFQNGSTKRPLDREQARGSGESVRFPAILPGIYSQTLNSSPRGFPQGTLIFCSQQKPTTVFREEVAVFGK